MKKLVLLLAFLTLTTHVFAQNAEILNQDWYLHEITVDGVTTLPPINDDNAFIQANFNQESTNDFELYSEVCDILAADIHFPVDDTMVILGWLYQPGEGCTLSESVVHENTMEVFLGNQANETITYFTTEDGGVKTLVINGLNGDQLIYRSILLNTTETNKLSFIIYPNPVSETLFITCATAKASGGTRSEGAEWEQLSVYDINGSRVLEVSGNITQLNVNHLASGLYFVEITSEGNRSIQKFVKN